MLWSNRSNPESIIHNPVAAKPDAATSSSPKSVTPAKAGVSQLGSEWLEPGYPSFRWGDEVWGG